MGGIMVAMTSEPNYAPVESTHVTAAVDDVALVFTWEADARIEVRDLGGEVVIEANAAGLRTLAGHLLVLAGDGVHDGAHLHLEDSNGLEEGSVGLVLERCDEE
ncbi:Imm32 family immunity protein [Streptomyces erythrochromogenes]|uniref:Imm32 family immunity protein n=1 Tax=Streptomyces erythrochromogenes TaxID=285574 RepID=UPI0033C78DF9